MIIRKCMCSRSIFEPNTIAGIPDYFYPVGAVLGVEPIKIPDSMEYELTAAELLKKFHEFYRTPRLLLCSQKHAKVS